MKADATDADTLTVGDIIEEVRRLQRERGKLPSERDLADMLKIKRHQLRKALLAMREAGDLQPPRLRRSTKKALPRYGEELVRVSNPIEVLEMRLIIEPGLARLASLRASAFEIARIMDAATTPPNARPGEVDLSFHLAIAQASRNHLAVEFYKMLRQVGVDARMKIAGTSSPTCPKRIAQRDAEHRRIAEAISQRDPEAAQAAMHAHLLAVQAQINERSTAASFAA
ncbi:FadR/GntR family transcriptional regulator [Nitratireductor sp. GCM10026969]|uniref:FadR/GntR family transcriptional regulator n=1 Tax=Nitratireductor sp. GCM10026969 TaxID=3252645 RepID=UPI0036122D61